MALDDKLSYKLTVRLFQGEKCFGPGLAQLLRRVRELKSLRSAAIEMNMAYSKAWRIIRDSEAALGYPLLERQTGGVGGGGAVLTPEGVLLLARYDEFYSRLGQSADALFAELFGQE